MVENCNTFYLVKSGASCVAIAQENGISRADLIKWNPDIGSDCTNMWANYYLCVSVEEEDGGDPPVEEPTATSEPKPSPIQPGVVDNCKQFHLVEKDDTCFDIVKEAGISLDDLLKWNTDVGGRACTGIWLDYYVCVGV